VVSLQNETDLQSAFRHLMEKVSCPYGAFKLDNSDCIFLHIWETKRKIGGSDFGDNTKHGWSGAEIVEEDEEKAFVTNLDENAEIVSDLWNQVRDEEEEEEDDGFGPVASVEAKKKKKKGGQVKEGETLNFRLVMKMSGEACSSKTLNCAPVVYYEKSRFENEVLRK